MSVTNALATRLAVTVWREGILLGVVPRRRLTARLRAIQQRHAT